MCHFFHKHAPYGNMFNHLDCDHIMYVRGADQNQSLRYLVRKTTSKKHYKKCKHLKDMLLCLSQAGKH